MFKVKTKFGYAMAAATVESYYVAVTVMPRDNYSLKCRYTFKIGALRRHFCDNGSIERWAIKRAVKRFERGKPA